MAEGRFVSYLRVSTDKQGEHGLGIEAQRKAVLDYLNGGRHELIAEYVEEVESGKRADRPRLAEAMHMAKVTGATLVIAKLDRLSRSVAFLSALMDSGADFVAADMPLANRLTVHILAAVAEHEREAISARTKAAMGAAKARGRVFGNPNGAAPFRRAGKGNVAAVEAVVSRADAHARDVMPVVEDVRASGITSLKGIAGELNRRGILTPQRGKWTATSVRRLLARAG
jgi:DNA invertase Pin-like site-specific DNA recombinase